VRGTDVRRIAGYRDDERVDAKVPGAGVCMGLNLIGHVGNLVVFDPARRAPFERLGER